MEETAIYVDGVTKEFVLPHEKTTSIKAAFTHVYHRRKRRAKKQHALRGVSFEIKKGEFFGIVGRNGSGKSTLLKILANIYLSTSGRVSTKGKLVPFIELGVGFNPELTGRENVYLNGAMLGFSRTEIDGMYERIVSFAELEHFMDQKLKNYSSGMQVRLAFSMAVRAEADILLVDEVLAVGDADFQRKCFEYFNTLKRKKKTVVFVTHDMSAVQTYCDRAILIEEGKITKAGDPNRVASEYTKLFMQTQATTDGAAERSGDSLSGEERWGDGLAVWESVKAKPIFEPDQAEPSRIVITAKGIARQAVAVPIFGFSIKNDLLEQLIGTNTFRRKIEPEPIEAGQRFTVSWTVPNIFNTGIYYVDCTVAHDRQGEVAERWPEAASFKITREEDNPYRLYSPDISFAYGAESAGEHKK